jgi:iron(III) transport system permease protein
VTRGGAPAALALTLTLGVLSVLPLARLALAALAPGGTPDIGRFLSVIGSAAALDAAWNTLAVSALGMLGALAIGAPAAALAALTDMPGRRAIVFLLLLPLMIAPQVTALAWLRAFGPASPLLGALGLAPPPGTPNPLLGMGGVALLFSVQHAPLVFLTLRAALQTLPRDLVEAARASGAGSWRSLRDVAAPMLAPQLAAAAALAFVAGVGNFGIAALLGLPVGFLTLPTLIWRELASSGPRVIGDVAALSLLTGLVAGLGVLAQAAAAARAPVFTPGAPARFALGFWGWVASGAAFSLLGLGLLFPVAGLAAASLLPAFGVPLRADTVTLANYVEVLGRQAVTLRAFANSTLLAGGAALILAAAAPLMARALGRLPGRAARLAEGLAELPYALPGVVLAVATILIFLRPLPLLGVTLYATPWIILFAYLARFLPLALKPVTAALRAAPPELEEAAAACGAGPWRRLRNVVAPLVAPAALAGGLLVFLSAFNELTVSALLWSAGTETLGVVLFNLEDGGYGGLSAAVAMATLAYALAILALLDRIGRRLPPGVLPWR